MYQRTNTESVIRLTDSASIPADPRNRDFVEYQEWLADGNTPAPASTPASVMPRSVSPGQGRVALIRAGVMPAVVAAVAELGEEAQAAFEFATSWDIDSPILIAVAEAAGLDLVELFTVAGSIKL